MKIGDTAVYMGGSVAICEDIFGLIKNQKCIVLNINENNGIRVIEGLSVYFHTKYFVTLEKYRNIKINKLKGNINGTRG